MIVENTRQTSARYLFRCRRHGLRSPEHCIVVEDSLSGIRSANAAGIGHIVALGPDERHSELDAVPGVADVIEDLSQFPRRLLNGAKTP